MSDAGLVSCIVPVRDGAAHLAAAIDSILAQTYRPIEVIVIDDGSTDESGAIASGYGEPVRVLRRSQSGGAAAARATGIAAARGEYVAFLDADDLWLAEKLERQVEHLAGPPPIDVSFCVIENFWEKGYEAEAAQWQAADRIRGSYLLQTALVRRGTLEAVPLDAERNHAEHVAWVLELRRRGVPHAVLEETLARRRRHATNVTRREFGKHYDSLFDLLKASVDRQRAR